MLCARRQAACNRWELQDRRETNDSFFEQAKRSSISQSYVSRTPPYSSWWPRTSRASPAIAAAIAAAAATTVTATELASTHPRVLPRPTGGALSQRGAGAIPAASLWISAHLPSVRSCSSRCSSLTTDCGNAPLRSASPSTKCPCMIVGGWYVCCV